MTDLATTPLPLDIGDYVQVKNNDDKPLILTYDSRRHVIEPGATRPIPFECGNLYFGDPRSSTNIASKRDNVGRVQFIPDRATEVRRLRTLYDNQMGDDTIIDNHPDVEVYDYDGNRVTTVLDDPSGETVTASVTSISENDQLRELLRRQQATIDMLAQRLGVDPASGREVVTEHTDVETDVAPGEADEDDETDANLPADE